MVNWLEKSLVPYSKCWSVTVRVFHVRICFNAIDLAQELFFLPQSWFSGKWVHLCASPRLVSFKLVGNVPLKHDSGRLSGNIYCINITSPSLPSLTQSTLYTLPDVVKFLRRWREKGNRGGAVSVGVAVCYKTAKREPPESWRFFSSTSPKSATSKNIGSEVWLPSSFVLFWGMFSLNFQHSSRCYNAEV